MEQKLHSLQKSQFINGQAFVNYVATEDKKLLAKVIHLEATVAGLMNQVEDKEQRIQALELELAERDLAGLAATSVHLEPWITSTNQRLLVHAGADCIAPCAIHAPSSHHMSGWPIVWDGDARRVCRVCSHSKRHPDPDDAYFKHDCDGCCLPAATPLGNQVPTQRGRHL